MMQTQTNSEKKMTQCSSCGGTEFDLLLSGKYRCKHCGAHQLPPAIKTHLVAVKTPFWSGNFFKQRPVISVIMGIVVVTAIYAGFSYTLANNRVHKVLASLNELKLQQQRSHDILQKNKLILLDKYAIDIKTSKIEVIVNNLTQKENDGVASRILDDLNGSFNREVVAKRNYQTALLALKNNHNWLTDYLSKKHNFTDLHSDQELKQGR